MDYTDMFLPQSSPRLTWVKEKLSVNYLRNVNILFLLKDETLAIVIICYLYYLLRRYVKKQLDIAKMTNNISANKNNLFVNLEENSIIRVFCPKNCFSWRLFTDIFPDLKKKLDVFRSRLRYWENISRLENASQSKIRCKQTHEALKSGQHTN